MEITLGLPDGMVAAFFSGVEDTSHGMQLVTYPLGSDDFKDGNTIKLPRNKEDK